MRRFTVLAVLIIIFLLNSLTTPFIRPDSNETYVVVNTLKFAATKSLEPSPYLTYGTLYLYLLLAVYGIMYIGGFIAGIYKDLVDFAVQLFVNPLQFYVAGRLLSAIFATGTIFLAYLIGKKFFNSKAIGVLAGVFLLLNKVHFIRAQAVLPDTAVTFFCALFVFYLLSILEDGNTKKYILAGMATGLIIGTKANGAVILVGFPLVHFLSSKEISFKSLLDKKLLFFGIASIVTLFMVHPYFFIKFNHVLGLILQESDKSFYVIKGPKETPYLWILIRLLKDNLLLGTMYILGLIYAVFSIAKGNKMNIILSTIILAYILVFGPNKIHNMHFLLPIVPILSIMAANFVYTCYKISNRMAYKNFVTVVIVIVVFLSASKMWDLVHHRLLPTPQEIATRWVEKNISRDKVIAMDSYENGPQIFTLERYFSAERLQDYRDYVPNKLKKRIEEYAMTNGAYSTIRVKYYHSKPLWPISFSEEQVQRFAGDLFMEREYRLNWRSLEELRELDVSYIMTSRNLTFREKNKYPQENLLYPAHQRMVRFYENLKRENGAFPVVRFENITIYNLRDVSNGLQSN